MRKSGLFTASCRCIFDISEGAVKGQTSVQSHELACGLVLFVFGVTLVGFNCLTAPLLLDCGSKWALCCGEN